MEQNKIEKLVLDKQAVVATLQYLQTRPWGEVNALISALAQAETLESTDSVPATKAKDKS